MRKLPFIFPALAFALIFSTAHGQMPPDGVRRTFFGVVVAEYAAKSDDDDDPPVKKKPHSSSSKKSSDDDAGTDKPAASTPSAKKKKKKPSTEDDSGKDSQSAAEKKSSVSEGDTPAPKKKSPHKDDDAPSPSKSEATADKPAGEGVAKTAADHAKYAPDATVEPGAIAEFASQSERIQHLITSALDLTKLNLTYSYGSSEPSNGGMDCSGTIYYLLRSQGFQDVPRDSGGQYVWTRKKGRFFAVVSTKSDSFEFKDLLPGDLMFWTGTYEVERDIPISHVMLYLGTEKRTGKRIMFGSSDGRSYDGVQRWGVSVFDFKMPKTDLANQEKRRVDFVGYARIPGLREGADPSGAIASVSEEKSADAKDAAARETVTKDAAESTPAPKKSTPKKPIHKKRNTEADGN